MIRSSISSITSDGDIATTQQAIFTILPVCVRLAWWSVSKDHTWRRFRSGKPLIWHIMGLRRLVGPTGRDTDRRGFLLSPNSETTRLPGSLRSSLLLAVWPKILGPILRPCCTTAGEARLCATDLSVCPHASRNQQAPPPLPSKSAKGRQPSRLRRTWSKHGRLAEGRRS